MTEGENNTIFFFPPWFYVSILKVINFSFSSWKHFLFHLHNAQAYQESLSNKNTKVGFFFSFDNSELKISGYRKASGTHTVYPAHDSACYVLFSTSCVGKKHLVLGVLKEILEKDVLSSAFYQITFAATTGGSDGKESACRSGDLGSVPGVWKVPRRRAWQSTPVFLPGESPWTESQAGYSPWGHDFHSTHSVCGDMYLQVPCAQHPFKVANARGGILSRCPAITAKSDGFRGLVPSILVMLVPVNDGGGRQGPDLETDGLGERRAWTSS